MTIATIRPDGYPQATTVCYVRDGLTLYFGCAAESQKAQNIAYNDKVSLGGKKGLFLVQVTPEVVSLLDYRKGFGHTDLVKI